MQKKNLEKVDIIVIGSGLSALNFIDTYLEKKKIINVISPKNFTSPRINISKEKKILPAQMKGEHKDVLNYFASNNLLLDSNCKVLGSLNRGGLSDYWGLQLDSHFTKDQKHLNKITFNAIENNFLEFLNKYKLLGSFYKKNKITYKNDYEVPHFLNELITAKDKNFVCKKPLLAFSTNNTKNIELGTLKEEKTKINSSNFFKKINKKNNIIFHDYYVEKIESKNNQIILFCRNETKLKKIIAKKVVFASGTIATTKIIMDYLNIRHEVKVSHHQRLFSVFFSRTPINYKLLFTPSLIQITKKLKKNYFSADLRPGNKLITNSIIDAFPFMKLFKSILNFIRHRLLFSNILLDPSYSNVFIKKEGNKFKIYSKNQNTIKTLTQSNYKVFKFLFKNKVIYPFFKTFYPGPGADYHYFGTIPFNNKGKLSVNNKCQLKKYKNIYVIDGSVFDFKTNKYPLGFVIANARRIGKLLSK